MSVCVDWWNYVLRCKSDDGAVDEGVFRLKMNDF